MNWYFTDGNEEHGPFNKEALTQLVASGEIKPETSVRQGEDGEWHSAEETELASMFESLAEQLDTAVVVFTENSVEVIRFEVSASPFTFGTDDDCDVSVSDDSISRRHAQISLCDGVVKVEDIGSTNGTSVNGQTISGAQTLATGDYLQMGEWIVGIRIEAVGRRVAPLDSLSSEPMTPITPVRKLPKKPLKQKFADTLHAGRRRIALAQELRQLGLKKVELEKEFDCVFIAIGTRAQESGDADQDWNDASDAVQAWTELLNAQTMLDSAELQLSNTEEYRKSQESRLADIQKDNNALLEKCQSEFGEATSEYETLKATAEATANSLSDLDRQAKVLQGQIAETAEGKASIRSANELMAEKAGFDARRSGLSEESRTAQSNADAAKKAANEKKDVLSNAKGDAVSKLSAQKETLKAADQTCKANAKEAENFKSILQMVRKNLGKALYEWGRASKDYSELFDQGKVLSDSLSLLEAQEAALRQEAGKLAPAARRFYGVVVGLAALLVLALWTSTGHIPIGINLAVWPSTGHIPLGINNVSWGAPIDELEKSTVPLSLHGAFGGFKSTFPLGWPIDYAICVLVGANKIGPVTQYSFLFTQFWPIDQYTCTNRKSRTLLPGEDENADSRYDRTVFLLSPTTGFTGYYSTANPENYDTLFAELTKTYGLKGVPVNRVDTKYEFSGGSSQPFYVEGWKWEDKDSVVFLVRFSDATPGYYYLGLFKFSQNFIKFVDVARKDWESVLEGVKNDEIESKQNKAKNDFKREQSLF